MFRAAVLCAAVTVLVAEERVGVVVVAPSALAPGIGGEVVVRFTIVPGWHLYWSNPGDSGLPPRLAWTLPPGWSAGEPRFPAPERHDEDGMVTWVHHGTLDLIQRLVPPAGAPAGAHELRLEATWLVCREQCVPGRAGLTATVQVGPAADAALPTGLPASAADLGLTLAAVADGRQVVLSVSGATAAPRRHPVAPAAEGVFAADHAAPLAAAAGWSVSLPLVAGATLPPRLAGVLWDGPRAATFDVPIAPIP
jgi:thiol:disulfide interchange protein DsbD